MKEAERIELIGELRAEIRKLKQEIHEKEAELQFWYDNAIVVTSEEKQIFYRMYRIEQKKKREAEEKKLAEELEKISTRIYGVVKKGVGQNEKNV